MKKKRLLSFCGHFWKRFSNSFRATLLRLKYKTNDDETQNSSQTLVKSSDIFLSFWKVLKDLPVSYVVLKRLSRY